jgi:hypothetical protein
MREALAQELDSQSVVLAAHAVGPARPLIAEGSIAVTFARR